MAALHQKGGKINEMPAHHRLEEFLDAYLDAYIERAGIAGDPEGPLFRAWRNSELVSRSLDQSNFHNYDPPPRPPGWYRDKNWVLQLSRHRNHQLSEEWRPAGGGTQMAGHESSRTTGLYDRRGDEISLDEFERISY